MINFEKKLIYIKKVMLSIEKLEQLQTAEDWSYRILNKHNFSDEKSRIKGDIKLKTMIQEIAEYLEKKWMLNQENLRK